MTIRLVKTQNSRYPHITITQDENRLVVRVITNTFAAPTLDGQDSLTTKCYRNQIFNIDNKSWQVVAVGEFDKREYPNLWQAGSIITFFVNPESIAREQVQILNIESILAVTGETEQQFHKRLGNTILCKLYCHDESASIIDSDKQLAVEMNTGMLITNIETNGNAYESETWEYPYGFVYTVIAPNEMKPMTTSTVRLQVKCNDKPCNGNFYVKNDSGYVADKIVKVEDGEGRFRITSLGMQEGSLRFSVGSRLNPSAIKVEVPIISVENE